MFLAPNEIERYVTYYIFKGFDIQNNAFSRIFVQLAKISCIYLNLCLR